MNTAWEFSFPSFFKDIWLDELNWITETNARGRNGQKELAFTRFNPSLSKFDSVKVTLTSPFFAENQELAWLSLSFQLCHFIIHLVCSCVCICGHTLCTLSNTACTLSLPILARVSCSRCNVQQLHSQFPTYQCSDCNPNQAHAMTFQVDV